MLVILFKSIEDAIDQLGIIREQLIELRNNYGELMNKLKGNANIEGKLAKLGFQPRHRVITIQAIPHTINIHMSPHSTWLLNKLGSVSERIDYVIGEIDKVRNYLNGVKGNSSVIVIIDYTNKKTRLVFTP
ncbi:MAG: hypothetical protein RXN89_02195 [Vulcanisaeta sp.]|jgi:hypothetical protein|uniref:hypothetical protein n=1 Tax=Vulcanisaeta sp. EB80 TaxID=1650660 RepID=UPI0007499EE1|nr:hypothetical protein [Vulcanisaeta sp. EB80]KUO80846.1 MAG: hypothetical protein AT718_07550 [Vulcanisaeta sp. JCHS_4]KUO94364.1 MAG: hypothetical protein AT717_00580 [Vulcanisaeta sp. CIS_19]MCG2865098.1 hypothetical protein [Vulcanisaeta sp.]PVU72368.1 hypothetical protein DDW08_02150 [Vulcanisaeta sp. SCGC AB-777_J10]MCG2866338.1 hypothetical protein [Vulcanisaeta sp.]